MKSTHFVPLKNGNVFPCILPNKILPGSPIYLDYFLPGECLFMEQTLNLIKKTNRLHTFIDIGANEGLWTINLASYFERVICFEPYEPVRQALIENTSHLSNVEIYPYALSNFNGTFEMVTNPYNHGMTKRITDDQITNQMLNQKGNQTFTTEVRTLDSFSFSPVNLIKIDAEGEDDNVKEGMKETVNKNNPIIFQD